MLNDKRVIIEHLKLSEPLYNGNDEVPLFQGMAPLTCPPQSRGVKGDVRQDRGISLNPAILDIQLKPEGKKAMGRKEFLNGYMR